MTGNDIQPGSMTGDRASTCFERSTTANWHGERATIWTRLRARGTPMMMASGQAQKLSLGAAATDRSWAVGSVVSVKLFDSHCHVYDEQIPDGTDGAVAAARDAGVDRMVVVGCDRATSLAALDIAARFDGVQASAGLHPHEARHGVDTIADLFERTDVVAVGEAGLDYFYEHSPRDTQRRAFAAQIQIAHERDLPLIIHTRDAWDDTFDVLDAEGTPTRTVFHCFTGGPDEAGRCLDLGAHLSFSGIVTFKGAPEVQAAARLTPSDRMLIETDAPYLAPTPHRGQKNRPAWVGAVAQYLADLLDRPLDDVAADTWNNAAAVFGPLEAG